MSYYRVEFSALNNISHYLWATGFGFNIPAGAQILGVEVSGDAVGGGEGGIRDNVIKLVKGGALSGNDKANGTGFDWFGQGNMVYGDPSDLWGLELTTDDVNAANFGVAGSFKCTTFTYVGSGELPHIRINSITMTVYYSLGGTTARVPGLMLFGGKSDGQVFYMSSTIYKDLSDSLKWVRRTGAVTYNTNKNKRVNKLIIRCKRGVGNAQQPSPTFTLRWSDNFTAWNSPLTLDLGEEADTYGFIELMRLGMYKMRQYEISGSDPVEFILVNMEEEAELLR